MKHLKLIFISLFSLVIIALSIYVFLIPFTYKINFKTKNAPWFIYHTLQKENEISFLDNKKEDFRFTYFSKDKATRFEWKLTTKSDQLTQAEVYVFSLKNKWLEKFYVIFGSSTIINEAIEFVTVFYRNLQLDDKNYKWEKPLQASFPQATCLCQKVNTKISEKANQMNRNIDALSFYLPKGEKSTPLLYINRLDLKEQTIEFDFCFQVPQGYEYKGEGKNFFVDNKSEINGEKQTFFGNYNESHRSWFNLFQRFSNQTKKLNFPMLEVFYDSPFSETNDVNWRSELYFEKKN